MTRRMLAGLTGILALLMDIELVELETALFQGIVQIRFGVVDHGGNRIVLTSNLGVDPLPFQANLDRQFS